MRRTCVTKVESYRCFVEDGSVGASLENSPFIGYSYRKSGYGFDYGLVSGDGQGHGSGPYRSNSEIRDFLKVSKASK